MTASVAANSEATLIAVTAPGATCQAKVKYHSGANSAAAGLNKKQVADSTGTAIWKWIVDPGTVAGTSTATVSCNLQGHAGSKSKDFVVF